ncbi:MAG TPA: serine/threonine-protein kinase [Kofleriaceae bacterium]|nr:serine/threonine-protein kinase [Kofleriaceae bacterium]
MTELPTTFGKYYLTEKLATGGMAEIYLAKIIGPGGFEKPLVIKQIHPKLSGNRHFVDLFVAEAKTLVTLAHGNIVPVYELGVVDDTYFIAMEYIDGPTLYRLTETMARREGHMEPALAAWITARILDGLDYAHRKGDGVIHRDLSPRNVMLSRDGEVKLVDFGIAVTLGDGTEGEDSRSAPTGSFPYMSPEQVRRESLSGQTDLFSVGVLAWEMLAGRRLFAKGDADATLKAVLEEPIPPPSSVRPEVPAKLDEVVMRALERNTNARWPTAADMLAQLNKHLYGLDETPGARDVSALVARYCPPETRRLPTNLEAVAHDVVSPEPLADGRQPTAPIEPAPGGPRTAVIPREAAARGKPKRHQTFATNVNMQEMLDRATPLLPFDAIDDTPTKDDSPQAIKEPKTLQDAQPFGAEPEPNVTARIARPPSRALLVLVGIGGLALAAGAVYIFFANRERVLHPRDASVPVMYFDAPAVEQTVDAIVVEPPIDAGVIDAGAIDAGREPPRDAGTRRSDATRPPSDASTTTAATGTLEVGAIPWGEIYVDGKHAGRTPKKVSVSAGHHTVEIVFPAESPPRKQTFAVDLASGETKPLQADFTN